MQARAIWTPPKGALGRLCRASEIRAAALAARRREFEDRAASMPAPPSLGEALRRESDVAVIAELKRMSPSKGELDLSLSATARTRGYVAGGARALSVLTEPREFGGSLEDLEEVSAAVAVPVIRKDFVVHPVQLWEARAAGAAAVLLIVRALGPSETSRLADEAARAGLEPLVEIRSEQELEWALAAGATIVGVNRRNLETLVVEDGVLERLIPLVPADRLVVAESGVRGRADVEAVATLGADAVLVGSSLSTAEDGTAAVRTLTRVTRRARAA